MGGDGRVDPQSVTNAEIEAMVRRYLAKVARRYAPLVIGLATLIVVVALVPTVSPKQGTQQVAQGNGLPRTAGTQNTTPGLTSNTNAAASSQTGASSLGSSANAGSGALGEVPQGITAPAAPDTGGVARSGVTCGPGALQVTWSVYAPPCERAYTGNNGGKTSYGVTGDTIKAVFRHTNSTEEKAAFAAEGDAAPGTDEQYLADLDLYLDYFNKNYELYGRKLVVQAYNGVGDNLEEDQGRMLQGAQADAATAHDLGAFMDMSQSPTLASTEPYEENLAQQQVIAIGAIGLTKDWYRKYAPWEYSVTADGSTAGTAAANALCQRAAGQKAVFAGDPTYHVRTRTFGVIAPDNKVYQDLKNELLDKMKSECGATMTQDVKYSINIATMVEQSTAVIAKMKTSNVTTVICICDPVVEIPLSDNADSQSYFPEWFVTPWLDPQGRQMAKDQWAHAISGEGTHPVKAQSEAYKVFKLAAAAAGNPNAEPQEQYFEVAYYTLLYVFNNLQRAGPNLNPITFEQSVFAMPKTARGDFGTWSGGPEAFSPVYDAQIGYWDPNAKSNFDGKTGAWISCEGGKWFPLNDPSSFAPAHTQLHCFGK